MNPLAALFNTEKRGTFPSLSMSDYQSWFTFNGNQYMSGLNQTLKSDREEIANNFEGYVRGAYKSNGVVFAVMLFRLLVFSEARFMFRRLNEGRGGQLFYNSDLDIIRNTHLFKRGIQDADLAGNFYAVKAGGKVARRRPDWMSILVGVDEFGIEEPIMYLYYPGGRWSGNDPIEYLPSEVAHFAPIPDPEANFRGMSWLTPILREIEGDSLATKHKLKFFENGATPNMLVKSPVVEPEQFKRWVEIMEQQHAGVDNAYRTMYIGGGADATVVGADLKQLDFKTTQGAGETRIAIAGGMHPTVIGLSEGLQGSSLNAGNYGQARRRVADGTFRPFWRDFAEAFSTIVPPPPEAELWYDDRDIKFLQEDQKDAAEIQSTQAQSIRTLVDAGYQPDDVIDAITNEDFAILRGKHSNLYSVQLQPAGSDSTTTEGDD